MGYTYGQRIWTLLMADIQNEYGVAALMGNLVAESNLMPNNLQNSYNTSLGMSDAEYTSGVDNGTYKNFVNDSAGYGLAQWTYYSRKQDLYDYKVSKGVSIADVTMQVEFLLIELKASYSSVYNSLINATNIRTPSDKVLHDFENPEVQNESTEEYRESLGQEIYNLYSGSSTSFVPRTTEPTTDNKYYIVTGSGGLNECIEISNGSALPNCVGYAWGRAYEIMGSRPTLSKSNAENWFGNTSDGYTRGQTPKVASIICWAKGVVGDGSDGEGHVAVVEKVNSDGSILTSNSAYGGKRFYTKEFSKGYSISGYTFQGFIYLPVSYVEPDTPTPTKRKKNRYKFILFNRNRKRVL